MTGPSIFADVCPTSPTFLGAPVRTLPATYSCGRAVSPGVRSSQHEVTSKESGSRSGRQLRDVGVRACAFAVATCGRGNLAGPGGRETPIMAGMNHSSTGSFRLSHFPPAVWATAFATLVAFMGIGVVDPILPLIGRAMGATPSQVEWLFTSYIAVMALAMLVSGVLATRLGGKKTLLLGLGVVVVFATASGLSPNIGILALVRGGWGLGNALFTSTALSIIVGLSLGGMSSAITLYEAALGLGIASGPLIGGWLGGHLWRYPFFGTATLMAVAFVATLTLARAPPRGRFREEPPPGWSPAAREPRLLPAA